MKIIIHLNNLILKTLCKMSLSLKEIIDIDDFYYGSDLFTRNVIVYFDKPYTDGVIQKVCILRRAGLVPICLIRGCRCGLKLDSEYEKCDNFAAASLTNGVEVYVESKVPYELPNITVKYGGPKHLTISLVSYEKLGQQIAEYNSKLKLIVTRSFEYTYNLNYLTYRKEKKSGLGYYARDLINIMINKWYSDQIVHIHGAESETVINMLENKMNNLVLYGLPNIEDDEFLFYDGNEKLKLKDKYGFDYRYFVYVKGEYNENRISGDSYDLDINTGQNLFVSKMIKNSGYRIQIVSYNKADEANYFDVVLSDGEKRYGILKTGTILNNERELEKEYNKRQFRSFLCRYFIKKMDLFDDDSDNLKIGLFCVTNIQNRERFLKGKLPKNFIFTAISEEASNTFEFNDVRYDGVFNYVEQNGFKDFLVDNLTMFNLKYDYMSFKDFECYVMPVNFQSLKQVDLSLDSRLLFRWGFGFNNLGFEYQTFFNSPTVLIKSASTYIRDTYNFTDDELHLRRFRFISEKYKREGINLIYHKLGQWSLCYYRLTGGKEFVDVAGHMVNLFFLACMSIVNFEGYYRVKNQNAIDVFTLEGDNYQGINYNRIEGLRVNSESRGIGLWHTQREDLEGLYFADQFAENMNLHIVNRVENYQAIMELIESIDYGEVLSISSVHDMGINLKSYYESKLNNDRIENV